jgi:hypothetical protein
MDGIAVRTGLAAAYQDFYTVLAPEHRTQDVQ